MLLFIGVITSSFLYLMKLFCKVNCWHKSLTLANVLLQIMHRNIYEFSIFIGKLSLATKKPLANYLSIMWLLSYNLDLYNRKLHNFNLNTICCNNRMSSSSSKMSCNLHMHILNIWNVAMDNKIWWLSIIIFNPTNSANIFNQAYIFFFSHHIGHKT